MAAIRETLILEDKFTPTMTQCLQVAQRMANVLSDARASTVNMETAAVATAVQMQELAGRMTRINSRGASLLGTIRSLIGTFLGIQSVRWLIDTSDQLTNINTRLRLMADSVEVTAAARGGVYQAAMHSRGAYADMVDFVSQLGMAVGNSFTGTDGLVTFTEQTQKQVAISRASGASAQAALVQLTQGLTSGTLRGEEPNSVLEQTPVTAQAIAECMGITTGEVRELANEGKVTAEVVKNAMFGAVEETNAQFEQMPMTRAQVRTVFQNVAIQALDPVLGTISWLANNIDLMDPIILGLSTTFGVSLLVANQTNICAAAATALTTAQEMLGTIMATTQGLPLIIIALVIGTIYAVTAAANHFAGTSVSTTGIIAGVVITALTVVGDLFVALFNLLIDGWVLVYNLIAAVTNFTGNAFTDPVGSVVRLFFDLANTVLGVLQVVASAVDIVFGPNLAGVIQGWCDSSGGQVDKAFGQGTEVMARLNANDLHLGRFEYGAAFGTGYNWGANLFNGSGNDAVGAALSGVPYDELSGQLSDVARSIGSIEKSVKMSGEDIKSLVDMAERRYMNNVNLTAQVPMITISRANTGRTIADRQSLANAIRDILIEQTASGSTCNTTRPASG